MSSNGTKALNLNAYDSAIQQLPRPGTMRYLGGGEWLARFAGKADDAPPWYRAHAFDSYTDSIADSEPFLASAIGTVATQYSTRSFFLDGPPRTVSASQDMLDSCDNGAGIISLFMKLIQNLKKKVNGAFLGIVREGVDYSHFASVEAIERYKPAEQALKLAKRGQLGRVVTLQSLDSEACYRTANPLYPVLYRDPVSGRSLWLPWHLVVPMSELPHPSIRYGGIQLSAVARVLRAAQIMSAHQIYKLEKLTGRSPDDLIIFNGLNRAEVKDQLAYGEEEADNENLLRWRDKALLFGINPEKPASGQVVSSKSDGGFSDLEKELQWYITVIALGFLETYQTFAPLQAGGLGNSQQSIMLFEGAQGKGPALWEKMWAHIVKSYALVPRNVTWRWGEKSIRHETDIATLQGIQLDNMNKLLTLGVPQPLVYQIMADKDIILNAEYLAKLGQQDSTDDISVADDEQAPEEIDISAVQELPDTEPVVNVTAKALTTLRRAYKASEAEGIVAEFEDTIFNAVNGYIEGTLNKRSAQSAFIKAVQGAWPAIAELGYEAGGGDWAGIGEEDDYDLEDATTAQVAYVVNYFADLPDIKEDSDTLPDMRTSLYVDSLRGVYAKYKALGLGNPMLTFRLGDAENHCSSKDDSTGCLELNGKRYSYKKWNKLGVTPGTPGSTTTCRGMGCQCFFEDDEGNRFSIGGD